MGHTGTGPLGTSNSPFPADQDPATFAAIQRQRASQIQQAEGAKRRLPNNGSWCLWREDNEGEPLIHRIVLHLESNGEGESWIVEKKRDGRYECGQVITKHLIQLYRCTGFDYTP